MSSRPSAALKLSKSTVADDYSTLSGGVVWGIFWGDSSLVSQEMALQTITFKELKNGNDKDSINLHDDEGNNKILILY